jgi:VanZ family protein
MNRTAPKWLRNLAWTGVGIWTVTIFILSSLTPPQLEEIAPFKMWDKAAHFAAFCAGAVNLALAMRWSVSWPWKKIILFTVLALCGYGAIDEIHQLFTPNRSGADVFDWLADLLGCATGAMLTAFAYARLHRENS